MGELYENLVGKTVTDMTAAKYNWPDKYGIIVEVDESNVLVKYTSGNGRWKALWNLWVHEEE